MTMHRWPSFMLLLWIACSLQARAGDSQQESAPTSQTEKFPILEYRVLGNSLLSVRQIEEAVYPFLGPEKSIADAQSARAALEKVYRAAGFSTVYVDIPEQSVDNGVLRLQVTEGKLERVKVSGARYFMNRRILAAVPSLSKDTVPSFPDVQQDLARLNRATPDLTVAPVLRPGSVPGTVAVELKVKDELPLHGSVEVNDRYTADTTHTRLVFNLSYSNLFQRYQGLALQYQMAPERPRDSSVLAATYSAPVDSAGDSLSLLAIKTDSDVATVGSLSVLGKGHIYGARYSVALPFSPGFYPSFAFGADYKKFDQSVLLNDGSGLQTPIQYVNWSAVYGASLVGASAKASFDVDLNFGIRGLGNRPADFENNRYLAKPNYLYLRFNGQVDRPLIWGTRIALRLATQYTTEPLIGNEQFAEGGADSVRGYLEAEELGDIGASGSLELRSESRSSLFGLPVQQAYVYGFVDGGIVGIIDPLPQQDARMHLGSWGAGLRISGLAGFETALDWAYPRVSSPHVKAGDSRIDFRFRYGF